MTGADPRGGGPPAPSYARHEGEPVGADTVAEGGNGWALTRPGEASPGRSDPPAEHPEAPMDSFAQLTGDVPTRVADGATAKVGGGFLPTGDDGAFGEMVPPMPESGYEDARGAMHQLLKVVVDEKASDLHLIAGAKPLLRVHGDLVEVSGFARLRPKDIEELIYSVLPESQRRRFQEEMELDCAYSVPQSARFRVNVYWQRGSVAGAFRIIPYNIQSIEQLGLPAVVSDLARVQRGLVVVTGPTGSGKSTTLAAMVDIVNRERQAHILTVEDPIEFLHKHGRSAVSQREVGPDTQGFAQALKHALRQDPDVILVGEMRDLETISTAITAAETGHLVFATLHTQDAPQTIDRIIDVFPSSQQQQIRVQLAITLQGVVAQQLLPTADGLGRVAAYEVLVVTSAVRNLIRESKTYQIYSAMQAGRKFGMVTMDSTLAGLVADGKITQATAFQHAYNLEELARLMGMPASSATIGR